MKFRNRYKFLGSHITLVREPDLFRISQEDEEKECLGAAENVHERIRLSVSYEGVRIGEFQETQIFIHEVLHHISQASGLELTESQVDTLARMLIYFVRENKIDLLDKSQE